MIQGGGSDAVTPKLFDDARLLFGQRPVADGADGHVDQSASFLMLPHDRYDFIDVNQSADGCRTVQREIAFVLAPQTDDGVPEGGHQGVVSAAGGQHFGYFVPTVQIDN